ncbi:olfactory receptor 5A2-like [Pteronotus mesoamericanus]|uniref:olfactory receptor 5A2-like n=1 Tax=Pteronotus mesoamericanus TaxID=1884717 RepID=UPI0023EDA14B|nr:olfactory receptor 5A2-like [Pteronotus parnellii mesoamericanus]
MAIGKNNTTVTKFILLGFSDHPQMKVFLFVLFLGIYVLTLAWNLSLIALIRMDSHLHTPMYFFLTHLSFLDICYVSSTVPRMLSDIITGQQTISFVGCATQSFVFCGMGLTECFLLAAMAYDRYAAICSPLLYTALMSYTLCLKMVVGAYMGGFLCSFIVTYGVYHNDFCGPNLINHFFCDFPPVLVLSCSGTFTSQVVNFTVSVVAGVMSILLVLISYTNIVAAVLKVSDVKGRSKAFSTCASHLTSVTLFYGSGLFMYMRPSSSYSPNQDKLVSIIYTLVIPMFNPIIYSLRNKEIKNALRKTVERGHMLSHMHSLF